MSRYEYDATKVENAVAELNNAVSALNDIITGFHTGVSTIQSAQGSEYIQVNYGELDKLPQLAEEVIDDDINTIKSKAEQIEDYNNAGIFTKLFSSIGMGATKIGEGILSFGETLIDGAAMVTGFVGGIFNSDFKNSCAEFVAKDHVGDAFANSYENGLLQGINKYSYFSHTSTAANVFKGVGSAAPYILLSATGVGAVGTAALAGVSGLGSSSQNSFREYQSNNTDPNFKLGDVYGKVFAKGLFNGAKDAAIVYTMTRMADVGANKSLVKAESGAKLNPADKMFAYGRNSKLAGAVDKVDDVARTAGTKVSGITSGIKQHTAGFFARHPKNIILKPISATGKIIGKSAGLIKTKLVQPALAYGGKIGGALAKHPGITFAAGGTILTAEKTFDGMKSDAYRYFEEDEHTQLRVAPDTPVLEPIGATESDPPKIDTGDTSTGDTGTGDTGTGGGSPHYYPGTTNPGTTNPGTTNPGTTDPGTTDPGTTDPGTTDQGTTDPGTTDPGTTDPGTTDPGTTDPGTTDPGTTDPGNTTPPIGGGGFGEDGFEGEETNPTDPNNEGLEDLEQKPQEEISGSLSELIGGSEYVEVPTSSKPITSPTTQVKHKSPIPTIAGLGAAAIAGIGTKAYLDKKEESNESTDEFETETWDGDEQTDLSIDDSMDESTDDIERDYLNPTDEYAYQEEPVEAYEAVNRSELESMQ